MKWISHTVFLVLLVLPGFEAVGAGNLENYIGTSPKLVAPGQIVTSIVLSDTTFRIDEPIIVDVYIENVTDRDLRVYQFSPISSSVGLPRFNIVDMATDSSLSIPPGLYGAISQWEHWYQPADGRGAFKIGAFVLPSKERIHLLHGDIREMLRRARQHCSSTLERSVMTEANTKKSYRKIVAFADRFLEGGDFRISVDAYTLSPEVTIHCEKEDHSSHN